MGTDEGEVREAVAAEIPSVEESPVSAGQRGCREGTARKGRESVTETIPPLLKR